MPEFDNHVGISICKEKLRLVEIVYKDEDFYLENVGELTFESTPGNSNELIDILQYSYQKISEKKPLSSRFVSFTFSPAFFKVFEMPYDNTLLKNDLKDQLAWELKKLFPYETDNEFLIQNVEYKSGIINRKNYTGVFALPKYYVKQVLKFCKNENLHLKFIDYPQTSSNNFLPLINEDYKNLIGLSLYLGDEVISIMLMSDGNPVYIKQTNYSRSLEIETKFKQLLEGLGKFDVDVSNIKYSVISGEHATDELAGNLSDSFGIKIDPVNPFDRIKISSSFKPDPSYREKGAAFAPAAGLALRLI